MKTRLLGAFVLIALAVLFVPMFFSSTPPTAAGDQAVSLAIPPAPDRDLQTRTMSLQPDAPASGGTSAPVIPARAQSVAPAPSDRLATVDITSRRPHDVELEPDAATPPAEAPEPQAPARTAPAADKPDSQPTKTSPKTDTATAARGHYTLNLSAYSDAGAQRLIQKVRALGYPVSGESIHQGSKALTLVTAGPFDTRTAAEAARLKITQSIPGAPAHLESGASDQHGDVAAAPAATPKRAGGFAVQVAAMGSQSDANALRDKLRAAGFDGFTDSVKSGGRTLWRVRAGPQTRRDDAERVRDQIKAKLGMAGNVVGVP
ncbi:SPOR domain-containing protein [Frateuria hangzhouensis]|uniref:SPOR domain-containing protein n=1 Tax=Frateuria hangzhouensis TaxID=2995589 RepID=UPI002260C18F|nr:SPOR domain-containing protein [Frateuria sp. STR12]MCX7512492.1 SPOR domain-containing protein [Frateuria sp. STR12]